MTNAATFSRENHRLAIRARWNLRIEQESVINLTFSVLLALPLALLWQSGAAAIVGIVYLVVYVVLSAVPMALYVLMIFDAARVVAGRSAAFMPVLIAMGMRGKGSGISERHPHFSALARLGVVANPLSSLTREMWILAFRFNPDAVDEMEKRAQKLEAELDHLGVAHQLVAAELREVGTHRATLQLMTC